MKFGRPKKKFGRPKKYLVYQKKIWSTKKMWNWPDNWYTKETDQKYMDVATNNGPGKSIQPLLCSTYFKRSYNRMEFLIKTNMKFMSLYWTVW